MPKHMRKNGLKYAQKYAQKGKLCGKYADTVLLQWTNMTGVHDAEEG